MIYWKKYFDYIYCIHYKPYIERFEELNNELKRVGILDSGIFNYLYTEKDNNKYHINANKVTINHHKCLKHAYINRYNRILILENDIKFLKDLSLLETYLENIPNDADLVLFDYIFGFKLKEIDRLFQLKETNKNQYIDIGKINRVFSAACYMCSNKMQKHLISNYTRFQTTPDFFTTYHKVSIDQSEDINLKRYIPNKNVAIQKVFENNLRSTLHGENNIYNRYKYQGINLEDYNI